MTLRTTGFPDRERTRWVRLAVFAGSLGVAATGLGQAAEHPASPRGGQADPRKASPVLQQLNSEIEELAARCSPAVVQIRVTGYGPLEESDHGQTALIARAQGIGSGVILDPDGYIMTNAHVVEKAQRISVILPPSSAQPPNQIAALGKQRIFEARLVGIHRETDLALLKIEQTELPTLPLGRRRPVHQGQLVFALGSPEGLENSVTMGVVSSVARQADPSRPMAYIQTDAPINPGNSGGPLIDADGYVVGINTFILTAAGGSEGLGFAIPARMVRLVYESLRKYGHVHRVEIKAGMQAIAPTLAKVLGLAREWGVVIDDVAPGGPSEAAGLQVGDIVVSADGRAIATLSAFAAALYLHSLDEPLKLEVLRGTEAKTIIIPVLEMKDAVDSLPDLVNLVNSTGNVVSQLGILALDVNDSVRSLLGPLRRSSGVVVVARVADFMSSATGLQTGDVIHSVNQLPIESVGSLRAALAPIKPRDPVVLQVEREGAFQWLAFEME